MRRFCWKSHSFSTAAFALAEAKPQLTYLPGWQQDISAARTWQELPQEARDYVNFIEKAAGCPITYVSVGPERDSIIIREKTGGQK